MRHVIIIALVTLLCPLASVAQPGMCEICVARTDNMNGNLETLRDISIDSVNAQTLFVTQAGLPMGLPVSSIAKISWRNPDVPLTGGTLLGIALGGTLGYFLGYEIDSKSPDVQSNPYRYPPVGSVSEFPVTLRVIGTGLGVGLGAFVGRAIAAGRGNETYDLRRVSATAKLAFLQSMFAGVGGTESSIPRPGMQARAGTAFAPQPAERGTLYLKDGSNLRGTIVQIVPGGDVKFKTSHGDLLTYAMAEVDKIVRDTLPPAPPREPVAALVTPRAVPEVTENQHGSHKPLVGFYIGGASCVGDFASANISNAGAGFGNAGFCAGADVIIPITRVFSFYTSATLAVNGVDNSLGETLAGIVRKTTPALIDVRITDMGNWVTIWPATGIRWETAMGPNVSPFAMAQFGIVMGHSPSMRLTSGSVSAEIGSASGTALALVMGGGATIGGKLTMSVRYMSGRPEFVLQGNKGRQSIAIVAYTVGMRL